MASSSMPPGATMRRVMLPSPASGTSPTLPVPAGASVGAGTGATATSGPETLAAPSDLLLSRWPASTMPPQASAEQTKIRPRPKPRTLNPMPGSCPRHVSDSLRLGANCARSDTCRQLAARAALAFEVEDQAAARTVFSGQVGNRDAEGRGWLVRLSEHHGQLHAEQLQAHRHAGLSL